MGERKESSRNITLSGVIIWLVKSGVGAAAGAAIVIALMGIGSTWRDVALQREHLSAHEESHEAEMERIDEKNAAQDGRLADHEETQARILTILERNEKALTRLEEQYERLEAKTEKSMTRLENKVDRMDGFLRDFLQGFMQRFMQDSENSASLDEEGPAKNVSASLCR